MESDTHLLAGRTATVTGMVDSSRVITFVTSDGLHLEGDLAMTGVTGSVDGAERADGGGLVRVGVVVCHPHPKMGGDRFNPVVDTVFRRLVADGVSVLRFDFRGVGNSEGTKGDGVGELLDVVAAVDRLASETNAPVWLCGYSFGAAVSLDVIDERVAGWLAIAPPLAMIPAARASGTDPRPKRLLIPELDQFSAPDATAAVIADWTDARLTALAGADHFFGSHLDHVADWAQERLTDV